MPKQYDHQIITSKVLTPITASSEVEILSAAFERAPHQELDGETVYMVVVKCLVTLPKPATKLYPAPEPEAVPLDLSNVELLAFFEKAEKLEANNGK